MEPYSFFYCQKLTTFQGFKSYAVRTVISGWDESFNSITGLNGSGKSNILDAICFVLGITNMSTVRAQNLQVCMARGDGVAGGIRLECKVLISRQIGPHLQARPGGRYKSERHNRIRQ